MRCLGLHTQWLVERHDTLTSYGQLLPSLVL